MTEETNAHAPPLFTVASTSSSRKSWTRRRRRKAAPAPAPATDSLHSLTTYLQSLKGFTVVVVVLQLLMHPCVFFSSSSMQDGIDIAITHFPTTGSAILRAAEDRTRLRGPHLDARRQLGES